MADELDSALAFVLQAQRRHIEAERVEAMTRKASENSAITAAAERATLVSASTLDAAADEFLEQIRAYVKAQIIEAVAATASSH